MSELRDWETEQKKDEILRMKTKLFNMQFDIDYLESRILGKFKLSDVEDQALWLKIFAGNHMYPKMQECRND